MNTITKVTHCPISNESERFTYIDFGEMPLVNNLCDTKEESINCKKYQLAVQYFLKSKLSCLTENIDPNLMFSEYSYKSGVVKAYAEHCNEMFSFIDLYMNLKENDKVLDIGGNDGTLLKTFLNNKSYLDVLNVDASENLTKLSEQKGIPTYNAFWGTETAKKLNKKFKLITSTNVFQHTPPIKDFVEAISMSLDEYGIWCLEFPYWKTNMETKQYDQIYHEHVYYYLLEPLTELFNNFDLEIINITKQPIHGGSLRLLISKKDKHIVSDNVKLIMTDEQKLSKKYYKEWGNIIHNHISECNLFLKKLKSENNIIVGFGAAAKGCIFLNTAKIDDTIINVVIDDTDLKQNKYIPGTGIQIKSREYLKKNKIDYILILAHNFKDVIIKNLKKDGYTGKFIVLFPTIEII